MKKYFIRIIILQSLFLILVSCFTTKEIINLKSNFDENKAKELLKEGNNTIKGAALMRQKGGSVVTCAGLEVWLYPATEYTTERIGYKYGNTLKGYLPFQWSSRATKKRGDLLNSSKDKPVEAIFSPDIKNYHLLTKATFGDALGNFEFNNISDGEFYVLTEIHWIVDKYWLPEGGYLMQKVSVKGGETKKIVMAP